MNSRLWLVSLFILLVFAVVLSSACRGQGHTVQPLGIVPPSASTVDIEAAVSLLCKPADITRSKNGAISGCKACPEGTDFFGQNMGEWDLGKATVGHFTSTSDANLILGSFNCDS